MFKIPVLAVVCLGVCAWGAEDKMERGRYLLEEVAKCQDCHTKRGEKGELDKTKWLKGGELDVKPIGEVQGWHANAPDLTPSGRLWQRWGEAGLIKFLTTGKTPRDTSAGPPMPTYKLKQEDAEAMVEYLKSLK